jgi:predicted nicotinamide N-methyase
VRIPAFAGRVLRALKMAYEYTWIDCVVGLQDQRYQVRSAAQFSTEDRASKREPLPFGSVLWPAAIVLSELFVKRPHLVEGKRVIELGCGLGLAAIVAAKLNAKSVLATDGHSDMPAMYAHNARLNGVEPNYAHYEWTAAPEGLGRFDLVIASDVLYELPACTLLADAIDRTIEEKGMAIVSDPGRPHWPRFLKKLEARGLVHEDLRAHLPDFKDPSLDRVLQLHPTAKRNHHLLFIKRGVPADQST